MDKKDFYKSIEDFLNCDSDLSFSFSREYFCDVVPPKDFSVLQNFTTEELAEELCRRTSLGKELK
jgi:hypothetical protein